MHQGVKTPVNFKFLTEKIQNEKGKCLLPDDHYDWVDGYRVNCVTGERKDLKIYYRIDDGYSGKCFQILNGVTGYESFYVQDLLRPRPETFDYWVACAMTKVL